VVEELCFAMKQSSPQMGRGGDGRNVFSRLRAFGALRNGRSKVFMQKFGKDPVMHSV